VINLKTAKCSVSTCRPPVRVRADETIEQWCHELREMKKRSR
jgi:hypothetical protein